MSVPQPVERIFRHWAEIHGHQRSALTSARVKLIHKALSSYSEADLCQSISGYRNSPHHMGANDRGTVYDSIDLMLRDAKRIDAGLQFYRQPPLPGQAPKPETAMERIMRANSK